jgi:hypothetical protein
VNVFTEREQVRPSALLTLHIHAAFYDDQTLAVRVPFSRGAVLTIVVSALSD